MRAPLNEFPDDKHYRCARPRVEEAWRVIFRAFGEPATQVRLRSEGACRKSQVAARISLFQMRERNRAP